MVRTAAAMAVVSGKTSSGHRRSLDSCTRTSGRPVPPKQTSDIFGSVKCERDLPRAGHIYEVYPSVGDDLFGRVYGRPHGFRKEMYDGGSLRLVPKY